jgi:sulfate adenylyltransferase subunit 1 (EFTu-like GTPase family)
VAADEGVREQTRRHAYILGMLGLAQVIVVINKMDLAKYSKRTFEKIKAEITDFLASVGIRPLHVIPISARDGDNIVTRSKAMLWHKGRTLLSALDSFVTKEPLVGRPLRFPVQDVYKVKDKRVLVGRVESGSLRVGDKIVFLPSGVQTKVKSIEVLWKTPRKAEAGESIGLTTSDPVFVDRGHVAGNGGTLYPRAVSVAVDSSAAAERAIVDNSGVGDRRSQTAVRVDPPAPLRGISPDHRPPDHRRWLFDRLRLGEPDRLGQRSADPADSLPGNPLPHQ